MRLSIAQFIAITFGIIAVSQGLRAGEGEEPEPDGGDPWVPPGPIDPDDFPYYNLRPYLQSLTATSVLIASQSKDILVARLRYGLTEELASQIEEAEPGQNHLFRLEGLSPGTRYFYRVNHVGVNQFPLGSFQTLPADGGEVTVGVIGDSGTKSDAQLQLRDLLLAKAPQLLLHTGDTVYPYGAPSYYYDKFFFIYKELLAGTCIYPSLGNHDCIVGPASPAYWIYAFHLPANNPAGDESYYSFDAGSAHFVALNSCVGKVSSEQAAWLDQDLEATQKTWKIIYFHHAVYTNSYHPPAVEIRDVVVPIAESRGVDLVLNGHNHVYERSYPIRAGVSRDAFQEPDYVAPQGIIYIVTGGGGASLYGYRESSEVHLNSVFHAKHHYVSLRITPEELAIEAIGVDGIAIDHCTIRKGSPSPELRFIRGDVNEDGQLNLTDPVAVLAYLFTGGPPQCIAASDVDASGVIQVTDAIQQLNFLFLGGPAPAAPFPECGSLPGAEDAGCRRSCP
ncbi:MAG TPA: metallophosphoesterase [Planctomycetota bacterium]|nr:metallophosphoesterase [Planctomycetota bacterium]